MLLPSSELSAMGTLWGSLDLDIALPFIKQQTSRSNYNPIKLIKEACDKQKVAYSFLGSECHQPVFQSIIKWQSQVSLQAWRHSTAEAVNWQTAVHQLTPVVAATGHCLTSDVEMKHCLSLIRTIPSMSCKLI